MSELDEIRIRIGANELILQTVINSFDDQSKHKIRGDLDQKIFEIEESLLMKHLDDGQRAYFCDLIREFQRHIRSIL